MMNIRNNVSLKDYSTMKLGGETKFIVDINTSSELIEAITWAKTHALPYLIIGGGSNIFWKDEGFDGILLVNKIQGIQTKQISDHEYLITAGAGENWDKLVEKCTSDGLSGVEYLSLIPGSCGATPIQNIGAYGSDISKVLVSVEAYDTTTDKFVSISAEDCHLGYRDSRFKRGSDKNRFLITSVTIKLTNENPKPPYYPAIDEYLKNHSIDHVTPMIIREAVIDIRNSKLPDPKINPNNGSFFTNPIISKELFDRLKVTYSDIVSWPVNDNQLKISAGWLIEQIGYKDKYDLVTGIATWPRHSLTLVNKSAKTTSDLLSFKEQIVSKVKQKFDINLEQEPELLPQS
ncbi:MAG TPA: UDP-N-acetylmuramate dehydrogenase [Candidatus Saccharimonadales bacterium]